VPGRSADRSMSALLAGLRFSGLTWCYADFSGAAGMAVAPAQSVFVHAVIHGTARLACAGGARMDLPAGHAVALLSGEAHALRTTPGALATPHEFLRAGTASDVPPSFAFGDGTRVGTRVLSGRLSAEWPAGVSRSRLPPVLPLVCSVQEGPLPGDVLARAGLGAGAAALLTRVAETLVVAALRAAPECRGLFAPETADPVGEALRLIAAAPAQPWTVESLARSVGMGRSNFAALFTRTLGKAPMEVVAAHRMDHAAVLLRQGRLKLAEIAELAGYGSEAAFSRRFTRHFGQTPSQHREAARQEQEQGSGPVGVRPLLGRVPEGALASPFRPLSVLSVPAPGGKTLAPDSVHPGRAGGLLRAPRA